MSDDALDLDFFSRERFPTSKVLELVNQLSEGEPTPRRVHDRLEMTVPLLGERVRLEFVH